MLMHTLDSVGIFYDPLRGFSNGDGLVYKYHEFAELIIR